jgi:hypothetical protein
VGGKKCLPVSSHRVEVGPLDGMLAVETQKKVRHVWGGPVEIGNKDLQAREIRPGMRVGLFFPLYLAAE